ncbi:MAG: hypothetical protein LBN39_02215, partial [Planctomycetaceae bacterium]|nr:hypothetical protein [Planctomycetaceae bacterium]
MTTFNTTARKNNARSLRIETLESREMLSVSAADFTAIKSQYEDLNLGNFADYNTIEITAAQLSETNLQNAINIAGTTAKNDLIVLRTNVSHDTITLNSTS